MSAVRFQFGAFQLDDERIMLAGPEGPVHVEPQVFELLRQLIVNRERVMSKQELLDAVWGHRFVTESALTSRVKTARQAVGDDGASQRVIRTAHGRGYQFVADVSIEQARTRSSLPRLRHAPIGRDTDVMSIVERIRAVPIVTVTGSGGIGKTTVALAVADLLQAEFTDGVVFVDLSPVPPRADVTRAVAEAAGVEGAAAESIERVADHLADRPLLLVLDNCEHVLSGVGELVDQVLEHGATIRVLATSREPLGVAGEHVWPLEPLHDEAPLLFVERARAAEPRVAWDPADPVVVELCRRLDGVPLAIELAAGQLRRFDLAELLRRLDDRLALLWGRAGGDGRRHATMETAIDWSYRLLERDEQLFLRQLSVFPSSFDLDAVASSAPPLLGDAPVALLGQLVDKSLVVRLPGSGRYRLLETIRAFSRDRLDELGESTAALERHRRAVRDRIASSSRLDRWMSARLGGQRLTDLDDARQAFRLSVEHGHVRDAVEIAIGASFLWRNAIGCVEGDVWVRELEALDVTGDDALWVGILRADVGQGRGDARQMFGVGDVVDLGGSIDDPAGTCIAAHYGALAHVTDVRRGRDVLAASLEFARRSADGRLVTLVETFMAVAHLAAGRLDEARAETERLDRIASDDGYDRFILHWTGWMLGLAEQDAAQAWRWMEQQQHFLHRTGIIETWLTAFSLSLCDVIGGDDIVSGLTRTLSLADREGYRADADCLLVLAYAEVCAGRFETAAELVGTAVHDRFNVTANYVLYRVVLDRILRDRLGDDALAAAMRRGQQRTAAEALADGGIGRAGGSRPAR